MLRSWLHAALAAAALLCCNLPAGATPLDPATPFIPTAPGAPVPAEVLDVAERWLPWGVQVTFESRHCGFDNAWYEYDKKNVILCDDLFNRPALLRAIVSHELAHGFQWQAGLDLSKMNIEFEADELSFWLSTPEEVEAIVKDYLATPSKGGKTHPANRERARMFMCLRTGVVEKGPNVKLCRIYAQSSFAKWSLLRSALVRK